MRSTVCHVQAQQDDHTATSPKYLHQLFTKDGRFATLSLKKPTVRVKAEEITSAVESLPYGSAQGCPHPR
jgi:hypothetical protein